MSLAVLTWSGVSRKTVWLWLSFTNAENQILKCSNSWNHWKFHEIWSIRQLNIIRNSGVLKTGLGQDAWKVWGLKPPSKQYGSGFTKIQSGNRRSYPESWTYWPNPVMPHQGQSTHESAPPHKGTPPYSCFEGDPTDKSRVSPPVARWEWARKHPLHRWEIFHHRGAVKQPEQQDLCWNVPWGAFWGCRDAITLPTSWFGGRCPIRGWHIFIFARKGWNWCPSVSRGWATRSCETA